MECCGAKTTSPSALYCSPSPPSTSTTTTPSSSPPQQPSNVVLTPCAACKILRRRCVADKCVLAPYFPPTQPMKFTIAHRVFGASNIIKFLQELPESQRADAVSSMVYEANARIRDPVYGCAGAICQLQKQISELQAQLAKAQAEVVNMQHQNSNLVALICMEISQSSSTRDQSITTNTLQVQDQLYNDTSLYFYDDNDFGDHNNQLESLSAWEPLWT